jgi:hypothetical protein
MFANKDSEPIEMRNLCNFIAAWMLDDLMESPSHRLCRRLTTTLCRIYREAIAMPAVTQKILRKRGGW